jgi:hypothetical protein
MDSSSTNSITFPIEWTVKLTTYKIKYRKAFDINEVDESFCAIINAKGGQIDKDDFGKLLGFNLYDLAEMDIFNIYLYRLKKYNLIEVNNRNINLTGFGKEALTSQLKYEYYYAQAQLCKNQNAVGEKINFSFKDAFGIQYNPNNIGIPNSFKSTENPNLLNKLQFQLFENDIYTGEVVDISENNDQHFSYKTLKLQCEITFLESGSQINFFRNDSQISSLDQLVEKPQNRKLRDKLIRQGKFYFILAKNDTITVENLRAYIDLCDWQTLANNPRVDWNDRETLELFKEHGDGDIWKQLSQNIPIASIIAIIDDFEEYWNWTILSQRLDDSFIKKNVNRFNWDFEELSYKDVEFVSSLLSDPLLKDHDWDWNYLSQNLSDEFIEENILIFNWDFYEITTTKNEVFKNVFRKYRKDLKSITEKQWNWKYISEKININFLYKNIERLASKIVWRIVLSRFFNDEKIIINCLNSDKFKTLLKSSLPDHYRISDQKYLWSLELIDFLEELKLINWETKPYIKGLDSNETVEWDRKIFTKYHDKITTEKGYDNVSKLISDPTLVDDFPDFAWNWKSISTNNALIDNVNYVQTAFSGKTSFTEELLWDEILLKSSLNKDFWKRHLEAFYNSTNREKHSRFWKLLTQQEKPEFIFSNPHLPWDWSLVTESTSIETILDSFEDERLINKWDWPIATRKLGKDTILENLEDLTYYIDWSFVLSKVFKVENELQLDSQLTRIAACLSVLEAEKKNEYWRELTAVYPFPQLFEYVTETHKLKIFEWDWDMISNHHHFPTDLKTLNRFKTNLNWHIFSGSKSILQNFDFSNWDSFSEWFNNVDSYLTRFLDYWDWKVLSQNKDLTFNGAIVEKFKDEDWDWEYLSEHGGFLKKPKKNENLQSLINQFPKIKFDFLSKRTDIMFESDLILYNKDKGWDWQVLSTNHKAKISSDLLIKLNHKNWNWKALSERLDIELNNQTLLRLFEKDWNWQALSKNIDLIFNPDFIEQTKSKPWDWKVISRHQSFVPNIETLSICKDFDLDWKYLSEHSSLKPTRELLSKFEDKWYWPEITKNENLNFSDTVFLQRFAGKWNWSYICASGNFRLDSHTLTKFKTYLDWDLISANTSIDFNEEIIQEFKPYWNWTELNRNKRVVELLGGYIAHQIDNSFLLTFLDKIEKQDSIWRGKIYHFSHIDNAVKIIREKKIKSRKTANQLSDSAGNVVYSRTDAHSFARFYFRPHTQTQFYNEYLGVDVHMGYERDDGWYSWYDVDYRLLDFPKCPKPIYFEFSLQEILFLIYEKCHVSTGNMQRRKTRFGKLDQMTPLFNFEDLFINPGMDSDEWKRFKKYAQQEFMIENELDFSLIKYFKVICADQKDRALLINLLGEDSIEVVNNIVVDESYYRNENPSIYHSVENDRFIISTNKGAEGYFILYSKNVMTLDIISGDVLKHENDKITFKSHIQFLNIENADILVKYVDEINQEWFVFSNYELARKDYDDIRVETEKRKQRRFKTKHINVL